MMLAADRGELTTAAGKALKMNSVFLKMSRQRRSMRPNSLQAKLRKALSFLARRAVACTRTI
jgi:hypothetical protein